MRAVRGIEKPQLSKALRCFAPACARLVEGRLQFYWEPVPLALLFRPVPPGMCTEGDWSIPSVALQRTSDVR